MATAEDMIAHGKRSGAWADAIRFEALLTAGGILAPKRGVIATYSAHPATCVGVVGVNRRTRGSANLPYVTTRLGYWLSVLKAKVCCVPF